MSPSDAPAITAVLAVMCATSTDAIESLPIVRPAADVVHPANHPTIPPPRTPPRTPIIAPVIFAMQINIMCLFYYMNFFQSNMRTLIY